MDDSCDPIVIVSFEPPSTFTFTPQEAPMRTAGKIQMHQPSDTKAWTFVRVNELPYPEYSSETAGNGKTMTVTDKHMKMGSSHYTVTVIDETGPHTSSDETRTHPPMITNQ
jgi:hypothetical protein